MNSFEKILKTSNEENGRDGVTSSNPFPFSMQDSQISSDGVAVSRRNIVFKYYELVLKIKSETTLKVSLCKKGIET